MEHKCYFDNDAAGNVYLVVKTFENGHLEKHERIRLHNDLESVGAKSVSENNRIIYADTDSVKQSLKTLMNSKYGKAVSDNMRKDYITVHINGKVGIVFKHTIAAVFNATGCDNAKIIQNSGVSMIVDESYSAIVKAVLS